MGGGAEKRKGLESEEEGRGKIRIEKGACEKRSTTRPVEDLQRNALMGSSLVARTVNEQRVSRRGRGHLEGVGKK